MYSIFTNDNRITLNCKKTVCIMVSVKVHDYDEHVTLNGTNMNGYQRSNF